MLKNISREVGANYFAESAKYSGVQEIFEKSDFAFC